MTRCDSVAITVGKMLLVTLAWYGADGEDPWGPQLCLGFQFQRDIVMG